MTGGTAPPLEVSIRRRDLFPLLMVATFVGTCAVSPWQPKDGRPTRRQHERRLAAVLAALDAVPVAPTTDDTVHRSYRWGHVVPLVVLVVAIVPGFVAGRNLYLHLPR